MKLPRIPQRPASAVIPVVDGPVDEAIARAALERMIRLRRIALELFFAPAFLRDRTRERPRRSARSVHALRSLGPVGGGLVRACRVLLSCMSGDARAVALGTPNDQVRIAVDGMYDAALVPPPTIGGEHFEPEGWSRFCEPTGSGPDGYGPGLVVDHHAMNDGYAAGTLLSAAEDLLLEAAHAIRAIVDGHAISPQEAHETCRAMAEAHRRVRHDPGEGHCCVDFNQHHTHVYFYDGLGDGPWEPETPDDPITTSRSRLVHVSLIGDDVILRRWKSEFKDLDPVDPIAMLRRAAVVGSVHDRARAIGMVAPERRP